MKKDIPWILMMLTVIGLGAMLNVFYGRRKQPAPPVTSVNGKYTLESSVDGKSTWTNANAQYAIVFDPREVNNQRALSNAWMDGAGWGFTLAHLACSTNRDFRADSETIMREAVRWNPYNSDAGTSNVIILERK